MLSNNIIIRTSDSHPIYNNLNERINTAKSILVGKHVWICPHSTILKGTKIGDGAIIASNTVVTKNVLNNTLVAGLPAKMVKKDIYWSRERLF
uniref:acyltransferase n=1 Tax=uncultured Bacteroides sp. TaxID=162156 RepID=UPI00280B3717|nr:acyltransferase [uncultured Bacteroides sp.]